mgnify:FL=1|jgi:large subunit ribosomal protein L21e|tara:strand:- start:745 stop:1029 length:285 start_codon:yes stop_codon:yes gene_type:complete
MARNSGYRRKTRSLLSKKKPYPKGLSYLLRDYKSDDKVIIIIDPTQVKGMPHRRFHGLVGTVKQANKRSLEIAVPVGKKLKTVIARFEHIKPQN